MTTTSNDIKNHHITTDDLAFSAYLKMKGYRLIKSDRNKSKLIFTFDCEDEDVNQITVEIYQQ